MSTGSNVEDVFEFTVYFPDSDEPEVHNGGLDNQRDLMENVLEDLQDTDTTTRATLIARPTKKLLSDFEGENLMMAFPLQFPYGIGTTDNEGNMRNTIEFYRHLLSLSSPHNHRADFVLVVHNMYERKRMVTNAYLKCVTGNGALAEQFGSIQEDEISSAADRWTNGASGSGTADLFLKKMEATAMSMSHTNGAAQRARQRMFALTTKFGAPSIFFTISPDDHFNYRIRILAADSKKGASAIPEHDTENIQTLADFDVECGSIRQMYPGLCAYDFEQVLAITIEHLLGWDVGGRCNNDIEGVFGDVDAWFYAVEEQGRKTLHAHFLIWIKNWSGLLKRLYEESTRAAAAAELATYIDEVMQVKLTGDKPLEVAVQHECTGTPDIEKCSQQDFRNLRYKHGMSQFGDEDIARCKTCDNSFSSEDIARKTMERIGIDADDEKRKLRMQVLLMRHLSGDEDIGNAAVCQVVGELHNLHSSRHVRSCFKKDKCCRMHVPNRECEETTVQFEASETPWYFWNGLRALRNLFIPELKRSHCDAFVNVNNKYVSEVLGSNNNVICGCDGGSCMYITCYTSKNTQKEDCAVHKNVAKYLVKKMRREEELAQETAASADGEEDDIADITRKGLSRLIGAVLLATSAHVVAAPMAAFLVRNDSRFGFSHEFVHCNTSAFQNALRGTASLGSVDGELFVRSSEANYTMRPGALELQSLHGFLSGFTVSRLKAHSFRFTDEKHPSKSLNGITPSKHKKIPIINHLDFTNAKHFEGHNIQTCPLDGPDAPPLQVLNVMDGYAGQILLLFHPFREQSDLQIDGSYLHKLRSVQDEVLTPEVLQLLQNVQDCRNALSSGRPEDALEQCTDALPFDGTRSSRRAGDDDDDDSVGGDDGIDESCYNIMEELMADAVLRPPVLTGLRDSENQLSVSTKHIRRLGSHNSGFKLLRSPVVLDESVVKRASSRRTAKHKRKRSAFERNSAKVKRSRKEDLYLLSLETVIRKVDEQNFYVEATGTAESIQSWADLAFGGDLDQKRAFEVIMSNFVLQFHYEADDVEETGEHPFTEPGNDGTSTSERVKRRQLANHVDNLKRISGLAPGSKQLICFLTVAGGSGKSKVLNAVKSYGKNFSENMGATFMKRAIVVTALTGTAAVTIGGETAHGACSLFKANNNIGADVVEWADSYLVIVDEVCFASKETIILLNEKLQVLRENKDAKYGGLCIVFAGDFSQLPPVRSASIYSVEELHQWHDWVNVLLQLNGNH